MELRQLKTFQTVARMLSFNRAATVLNYSQSAVSTQIKLLEEEFGVPLFHRLGKRICLTEAGRMLQQYSQKILDIEQETLARISGWEETHGSISIRIPQSICSCVLPSVLSRFQAEFPRVGFDISVCAYESLVHELKTGTTDLAFLLADSVPFSELKSEVLAFETLAIVSSPDHILAKRPSLRATDLSGHTILLPKHDCSYKTVFQRILAENKVEPATYMEINSLEAIKQCVFLGIGVAMLPMMAIRQDVERNAINILPWSGEHLETAILMLWHKNKWLSPILKAFMHAMRQALRSPTVDEDIRD